MSDPRRRALVAVGAFILGAGLLLGLEHPVARAAGVLLLVGFVVLGTAAIATPAALARDPGEED